MWPNLKRKIPSSKDDKASEKKNTDTCNTTSEPSITQDIKESINLDKLIKMEDNTNEKNSEPKQQITAAMNIFSGLNPKDTGNTEEDVEKFELALMQLMNMREQSKNLADNERRDMAAFVAMSFMNSLGIEDDE